jgi:hypothetical protein
LFFAAYGYPLGPVFTATILYRIITYWPALIVGVSVFFASGDSGGLRSWTQDPVFAAQLHRKVSYKQRVPTGGGKS